MFIFPFIIALTLLKPSGSRHLILILLFEIAKTYSVPLLCQLFHSTPRLSTEAIGNQMASIHRYSLQIILALIALFASLWCFYYFSTIHIEGDEAIIAEHSMRLAEEGKVRSEMFTGMGAGWEQRQYHYHKLFVLIGTVVIDVFGLSLLPLRCISLVSAFVLFFLIFRYSKSSSDTNTIMAASTTVLFLIAFYEFSFQTFLFRPELLVCTLGFSSFLCLKHSGENWKYTVLAGFLSGLAAATHLNGLVYIVAGLVILTWSKRFKHALYFGVFGLLGLSVYLFDIRSLSELQLLFAELTADPNLASNHLTWYSPLLRVLDEHKRFFHNPYYITMSLVLIYSLVANYKQLANRHGLLLKYLLLLILFFPMITHGPLPYYIIIYLPFIAIVVGSSCSHLLRSNKRIRLPYLALAALFFVVQTYFLLRVISTKDDIKTNHEIASYIPHGSKVLTREAFFFDEAKNFDIRVFMALEIKHRNDGLGYPSALEFLEFAKAYDNDFLAFEKNATNSQITNSFAQANLDSHEIRSLCSVVQNNNDYCILKIVR